MMNDRRELGNTGIMISSLGFGCAAAWGKAVMGKSMVSDEDAQALVEEAYRLGINYFDTGYVYGFAEERLGKIIESTDVFKREDIVISTKFGERFVDGKWTFDWSPEWMEKSLEISMERLKVDHVDMYLCHGGKLEDYTPELVEAMKKVRDSGRVKAIGISTFSPKIVQWVIDNKDFDFVMIDYNILSRSLEPLTKTLHENGIGAIAGSSLAKALYSKRIYKIRSLKDVWYLARAFGSFRNQMKRSKQYRFLNEVEGMSSTQIALRYVLDNPYIAAANFATTSIEHLRENAAVRDMQMPPEIAEKLKQMR